MRAGTLWDALLDGAPTVDEILARIEAERRADFQRTARGEGQDRELAVVPEPRRQRPYVKALGLRPPARDQVREAAPV
jgi:hypothetical protein